ncbi:MAG: hypothetical protein ACE5KM_00965, partial [Planctomycetaceae bacterium]
MFPIRRVPKSTLLVIITMLVAVTANVAFADLKQIGHADRGNGWTIDTFIDEDTETILQVIKKDGLTKY